MEELSQSMRLGLLPTDTVVSQRNGFKELSRLEKMCEAASISVNRNTVCGDAPALSPGGVRIGAPAMTTRGYITEDFKRIAGFLDRCASIVLKIHKETSGRDLLQRTFPFSDAHAVANSAHGVIVPASGRQLTSHH